MTECAVFGTSFSLLMATTLVRTLVRSITVTSDLTTFIDFLRFWHRLAPGSEREAA